MLPSLRPDGSSRVVPQIAHGAGVAVTRPGCVAWPPSSGRCICTACPCASGALALIDIAHPNHREPAGPPPAKAG